jgi:hypothetical protein
VVCTVLGIAGARAPAQDPCEPAVLDVGDAPAAPGGRALVAITGSVACEVTGFSLAIGHDPARVRCVDAAPGEFLTNHAGSDLFFQFTAENDAGYAVVGALFDFSFPLTVPATSIPADTTLAVLTYEALEDAAPGIVPLLNRTRTYGESSPVANIYARTPGEAPLDPALGDGAITLAGGPEPEFVRGNANPQAGFDLSDGVFILLYLFSSGEVPPCLKAADANDDARADIADGIYVLQFLFTGGPPPPAPFPACGADLTQDGLTCVTPPCP